MIQLFLFVRKLFNGQKKRFFGLKISFLMNKDKKVTDRNQAMAIAFSKAKKLNHGGKIKAAKCRNGLAKRGKTRGIVT